MFTHLSMFIHGLSLVYPVIQRVSTICCRWTAWRRDEAPRLREEAMDLALGMLGKTIGKP